MPEETSTVEVPTTEQENIDVANLSDDELKKLASEGESQDDAASQGDSETTEEGSEGSQEEESQGENLEKTQEGDQEETQDESTDDQPSEETEESKLELLAKEVEELKKLDKNRDVIFQRQATELGLTRKLLNQIQGNNGTANQTQQATLSNEELFEKFQQNPREFIREEAKKLIAEERQTQQLHGFEHDENKTAILQKYPDFEKMIPDLADYGRKSGDNEESIMYFKQNPYSVSLPAMISLIEGMKSKNEVRNLRKELDSIKNNRKTIAKKINRAAKEKPAVSSKSGQATSKSVTKKSFEDMALTSTKIAGMSDKQLAEAWKLAQAQEEE